MRWKRRRANHALSNEFKRSQDEIAKIVGKSRSHVANMMRLTKLPAEVQAYIALAQLSGGSRARADRRARSAAAAKRIAEEGLNVRQAEALAHVEGGAGSQAAEGARGKVKDPDTSRWRNGSATRWAWPFTVDHRDPGGTVHIRYGDLEQLDEILRRLDAKG